MTPELQGIITKSIIKIKESFVFEDLASMKKITLNNYNTLTIFQEQYCEINSIQCQAVASSFANDLAVYLATRREHYILVLLICLMS